MKLLQMKQEIMKQLGILINKQNNDYNPKTF